MQLVDNSSHIAPSLDAARYHRRAGEGVKRKILITYGLDPETATLPITKKGEITSDDVAFDIARSLTQDWHNKCAHEAVKSGLSLLTSETQAKLDNVAKDLITRLTQGLSLRSTPTTLKDPFYTKLIQKRSVQEHLANLYLNYVSKEALAEMATFGFSPDSTLSLVGCIIWKALYITYENNIQTGFGVGVSKVEGVYLDPQKPSHVNKSNLWIQQIRKFGPKLAKTLEAEYKAAYPEPTRECTEIISSRKLAAHAARERSHAHKKMYPDWYAKENTRRSNAAQHNEK